MKEFDIQTTHGKLHIYQKGSGQNIVILLHGAGCDSAILSWQEVITAFDDSFTVYAFDLLGYGKSDKRSDLAGKTFYNVHIEAGNKAITAVNANNFILVGLSMGGAIAIGYCLKYPQRVKLLVPVDTWGVSPKMPMHKFSYWYINHTDWTVAAYRMLQKNKTLARWSIEYSLMGDKNKITDQILDLVMEACGGDKAGQPMQNYQRSSCTEKGTVPYYTTQLESLNMPIFFVNGEKDTLVTLADVEKAVKSCKNASLLVLKGCKHWSVKERPQEFVQALIEKTASQPPQN